MDTAGFTNDLGRIQQDIPGMWVGYCWIYQDVGRILQYLSGMWVGYTA
jgi:hypothetical protein